MDFQKGQSHPLRRRAKRISLGRAALLINSPLPASPPSCLCLQPLPWTFQGQAGKRMRWELVPGLTPLAALLHMGTVEAPGAELWSSTRNPVCRQEQEHLFPIKRAERAQVGSSHCANPRPPDCCSTPTKSLRQLSMTPVAASAWLSPNTASALLDTPPEFIAISPAHSPICLHQATGLREHCEELFGGPSPSFHAPPAL